MTRKRPDIQPCGERHYPYLHCLICNAPPAENPERLQGPEVGTECIYTRRDGTAERVTVTERSYVWAPGDPSYHGGARRYDWKVIARGLGRTLVVDDKDLTAIAAAEPLGKEPHAYHASFVGGVEGCYYCGRPEDEHDEQPLELHGIWPEPEPFRDAISVRAAFAFGDWKKP